jgi:hypothetical protein
MNNKTGKERKNFRAGWRIKKTLSFFFIVIERKIEIHWTIKKFSFQKRRKKIDKVDRKGRRREKEFRLFQMTKENLSGFDSDTRKLIMTEILEFHCRSHSTFNAPEPKGKKRRKINKKTIIFNRNLCFFLALLSPATFMLSINFHFLLFGHSLDCLTSFKSPAGGGRFFLLQGLI